jgi:deferrochelatase/peroxidase EfeB
MTEQNDPGPFPTRRGFLAALGGLLAVSGPAKGLGAISRALDGAGSADGTEGHDLPQTEPFWGAHQGGIEQPQQKHAYFAAFDLVADSRDEVIGLLRSWTSAAASLTRGEPLGPINLGGDPAIAIPDSGEALGLQPARLTLTFGLGAGFFIKDGKDRYGIAARRPEAFVDLPRFNGEQLVDARTGGDLSIQACADDPQVAFHAVRQLARLASGAAHIRWAQTGFLPDGGGSQTPRNLMGFKDGTINPSNKGPSSLGQFVWVGDEGPEWMRGGSYMVVRRIRMALEHWDSTKVSFQERTIGREKLSGAPLGMKNEFDALDLKATDSSGELIIPENAHVRLGAPESNDGTQILRRSYSYNEGVDFTVERWPPWRQGMEYDAGLFFVCYQRDLRTGFIKIFDRMSKVDMLNQFVTHTGGGAFACLPGAAEGQYIGQRLLELA